MSGDDLKLRALVTGATGVIGPPLVRALQASGFKVRVLTRSGLPCGFFPKTVEVVQGDLADYSGFKILLAGVDRVFHLAALLHINNPPVDLKEEYYRVNVIGSKKLAEASAAAGVERFVFFSTINVYGASDSAKLFDETSPLNPDSWYAESKAEAESLVASLLSTTVLRFSAVYGARMKGNYLQMLKSLKRGIFVPVGRGANRRCLLFEDDAAQAALLSSIKDVGKNRVYNVSDGGVYQITEIIAAACKALERREPLLRLPVGPVRFAFGLAEDIAGLAGKKVILSRTLIDKYTEDMAVSAEKIRRELGFQARYDLAKGWKETVARLYGNSM